MWNHSVLLMLRNFCRHFVILLVCRHLRSVTLWNWAVGPEVSGKLPSLSSSIRFSQRLRAPVFTRTERWEASMTLHCLSFLSAAPHGLTDVALRCFIHPVSLQWRRSQGVQAVTQRHLFGSRLFYFIPLVLSGGGRMEGDHTQRRITDGEAGASALIRTYGPSSSPGAAWPMLNGTPRKSRLCRGMRCSTAVSFPLFLARPGFSSGLGTADWTAGQFRADCCPAGISLHVLPAWLVDTHKHTGGDLARRPASLCSLLVHLCPLAGFLVWIWWTGNKGTDSLECRVQVQSPLFTFFIRKKCVLCLPLKCMYQVMLKD